MSGDTFEFDDNAHVGRLTGTLHDPAATPGEVLTVQNDGSVAAAPGGGSSPVQATYGGSNVSIGNGVAAFLTWDMLAGGPALLDITDPANPTFVAAGTYAVTVTAAGDALTASGSAVLTGSTNVGTFGPAYTQTPADFWGVSGVFVVTAGDTLNAAVANRDGVSTRDFSLASALVVKLA